MTTIATADGKTFNLLDPDPETITIEHIAHALARIPRWLGILPDHYSVAEHSWLVAEMVSAVDPAAGLAALLHDAAEAYIGDCPSPIKGLLGESWRVLEDRIQTAIERKYGLVVTPEQRALIKDADLRIRDSELWALYRYADQVSSRPRPTPDRLIGIVPAGRAGFGHATVKRWFIARFEKLGGRL